MNLIYFLVGTIVGVASVFFLFRYRARNPIWLQGLLHTMTCAAFCMPGYDSAGRSEAEAISFGARLSLDPDSPVRIQYQTALVWKCVQCRRHTYFYTAPGDFYPDSKAICDDCFFGTEPEQGQDGCVARGFAVPPGDDVSL